MKALNPQLKVYKSSAGSGKTTTLSLEYLKLTLGHRDAYKHILALTFTNKAAQEMKDRILEYLDKLIHLDSSAKPPFYVDFLFKESTRYENLINSKGISEAKRMIINDAIELKKNLLHNYSEYAVTTIDSFTNRLIRSFSHDLGLSFNYQVEMNADQMLKDAVEELVSRINNKEELITKILTQYSRQKIDNERSRNIVTDIKTRAKSLLNDVEEEFLKPLRDMKLEDMVEIQNSLDKDVRSFENILQAYGQEFMSICINNDIPGESFYQGNKGIYGYFNRFNKRDFSKLIPNNYTWATVEEEKWTSGKANISDKANIDAQSGKLLNIFEQTYSHISLSQSDYILKSEINAGIYPFMVLMELEKILNQMKMDQQMIHISDFNKIISEKVANEPAPYIYERIGNKYQHYLLDEFQDTSVIQWHNLLPLVENSLSENHFNLIVGDAKQSIYRFRGSDVEQFAQFPKLIVKEKDQNMHQKEQLLIRSYDEVYLNANFRTGKNIVDFNNHLFQFIVDQYLPATQTGVYKDLFQESGDTKSLPSSVEIHLMDVKPLNNIADKNQAFIERSYQIIKACIEDGYDYKDIVVLARKNKHLIQLAHYLLSQGIPVISTESLHVSTSPLVQFLLSMINHLYEPQEKIYQTEIIHFLMAQNKLSISDEMLSHELLNLRSEDELEKLWEQLHLDWDQQEILKLEAYEALEILCQTFQLEITQPLLHFFLEAAFIFTQENHQSIGEFREWWALNSTDYKLDVPEEWDAVKLMSFHKSKGLEFPIVINHFSEGHMKSGGFPPEIWLNPQMAEYPQIKSFPFKISKLESTVYEDYKKWDEDLAQLDMVNLFYVAMTRPQQRLYLLVDKYYKKNQSKGTSFQFDKMIDDYLQNSSLKEISESVFHIGDNKPNKHKEINQNQSLLESVYIQKSQNTRWRDHVDLALDTHGEKSYSTPAIWGQKVHAVLAELSYLGHLDFSLKKMVYQGFIDPGEQTKIADSVQQVLQHPLLHNYYGSQALSFSEREIFDANSQPVKIKRPDYIVHMNDHFVVIDYKTGKAKSNDIHQIQEYCHMIEKHSQKPTKAFLVYLGDTVEVKQV